MTDTVSDSLSDSGLSLTDAAAQLGISERTLLRRIRAGTIVRDGKDSQETGQIEMVGVQGTSFRPLPVHELITGVS